VKGLGWKLKVPIEIPKELGVSIGERSWARMENHRKLRGVNSVSGLKGFKNLNRSMYNCKPNY
jgi:hypothetical protein